MAPLRRVQPRQHGFDRISQIDDFTAEGEANHVGKNSDLLPPSLDDGDAGQVPLLGTQELEFNGRDICLRVQGGGRVKPAALDARSLADCYRHPGQ